MIVKGRHRKKHLEKKKRKKRKYLFSKQAREPDFRRTGWLKERP